MSDEKRRKPFYIASISDDDFAANEEEKTSRLEKPSKEPQPPAQPIRKPRESEFISPVLGRVKNDVVVPQAAKYGNKGLQYESFRDTKMFEKNCWWRTFTH